jgi:hypothetical protein
MKRALLLFVGLALAAAVAGGAAAKSPQLWITHFQKGCHVWSNGAEKAATMQLTLRHGTALSIINQDLDQHQLVQLTGPKVAVGRPMMMNHPQVIRFAKVGIYRFTTKVSPMAGMPDVKTIGPDNVLRLTVRVT